MNLMKWQIEVETGQMVSDLRHIFSSLPVPQHLTDPFSIFSSPLIIAEEQRA